MPVNPKSLENLRPCKPGEVRNPDGVRGKKKQPLSDAYRWWLTLPVSAQDRKQLEDQGVKLPDDAVNAHIVAIGQGRRAIKKPDSAKEMREGSEGKATVRLEVSGPDGDVIDIAYRDMTAEELAERRKRLTEVIEAVTSTEDIEDPAVEMVSEGAPVQAEPIIEANSSSDETSEIVPPKEEKKTEGPPVDFQ